MSNLNLFDKAGHYTAPDAATFAALSDPERVAINRIGEAAAVAVGFQPMVEVDLVEVGGDDFLAEFVGFDA